ncbi:MAG: ATP-dependent DNA ligase [Thermoplasmataceae archaeon]
MLFSRFSEYLNQMTETSKRLELKSILSSLFLESGSEIKKTIYLIQGKIAPDYEGKEFEIADETIMEILSEISGVDKDEITKNLAKIGDIGTLAYEIKTRSSQRMLFLEDMTIDDVFSTLKSISEKKGGGSIRIKKDLMKRLLLSGSPDDAKYIVRIALGKLRLGVADSTILQGLIEAFNFVDLSEEVENYYNFSPDLGNLSEILKKNDRDEIKNFGPRPFVPFKVMLAERLQSIPSILEKMGGKVAFEYKYDGLRAQVHIRDGKVKIFSRGNEETTSQFPDVVEAVKRQISLKDGIVDGELVPYNPETEEIYPFQEISRRRGRKKDLLSDGDDKLKSIFQFGNDSSGCTELLKKKVFNIADEIPITLFLFDIVYLNGRDLSRKGYSERRRNLEEAIQPTEKIKLARRIISSDASELEAFFELSIENGCEGIVAKSLSEESIYRAGARGWNWIKYKRDYQSLVNDTFDLVVVGAFWGHGRRGKTYGALLLASFNPDKGVYETFCKLGTGFTDEVLFSLPRIFSDLIVQGEPNNVDAALKPDVWIYPQKVMEVKGAEITVSPVHTCNKGMIENGMGLALRFPRFTGRWRDDKKPESCTSNEEILEMYKNQKKGL